MDRYFRFSFALLAVACGVPSLVVANETLSIAPSRVIEFGDPDALDENPQRRTAVVTAVVVSPDAARVAAAGDDHMVRLFDVATGELTHQLAGHDDWVRGLSLSASGETLVSAAADRCCRTWDAHSGESIDTTNRAGGPLRCVAFHPNGLQYAAAGFCCPACIYNLSGGHAIMHLASPRCDSTALAFSPDGETLAVAAADGYLRLWRTSTGEMTHEIAADTRRLRCLAFSPDGQTIATGGDGKSVRLWDVETGEAGQQISIRPAKAFCLHYLSDAELAIGGTDNRIQVWRTEGPSLLKVLEGHTGTVSSLASDATGKVLVSGSYDTTVRVWHLDPSNRPKTAARTTETNR